MGWKASSETFCSLSRFKVWKVKRAQVLWPIFIPSNLFEGDPPKPTNLWLSWQHYDSQCFKVNWFKQRISRRLTIVNSFHVWVPSCYPGFVLQSKKMLAQLVSLNRPQCLCFPSGLWKVKQLHITLFRYRNLPNLLLVWFTHHRKWIVS